MNETSPLGIVRHHDVLQPFTLHKSAIKGRMVRLGEVVDTILRRHHHPDAASKMLGELLTLTAMLSAELPEGGILTCQAKGDGAVTLAMADAEAGGNLRGYLHLNETGEEMLAALEHTLKDREPTLAELMGKGYLAITLDMGDGQPHQGIVSLEGDSMTQAVTEYFTQSAQMEVAFHSYINKRMREDGTMRWRSGAIMLEKLPEQGGEDESEEAQSIRKSWDYNKLLVETATEDELLDPHLAPKALLYRLFNEGGVWVAGSTGISANCRCSREKFLSAIAGMSDTDIADMQVDGIITATCQFCNQPESFTQGDIDGVRG